MKRIAVIEPGIKNHTPIMINWAKICELKGWELTVYTTQECFSLVEDNLRSSNSFAGVEIIETLPIRSLFKYIRQFRHFDNVLIASLYSKYFSYFLICLFCQNCSLTVHNVNKWFRPERNGKNFYQNLKNYIHFIIKRGIIKSTNKIIVNSQNQKDYLETVYSYSEVLVIPFKMSFSKKGSNNFDKLKVVYPGIISDVRKKYSNFLFLAERYPHIEFILLGELKNDKIGKFIQNEILTKNLNNIMIFHQYVSNECFDSYMEDSNLIFSDINVTSGDEIYGKSKDSGASYLMAEYALPFIVNEDFNNLSCLDSATIYFSDKNSLINVFDKILNNEFPIEDKINEIVEARKSLSLNSITNSFNGFS
jgi:hypothetical protein